ncbi:hypothetical protein TOPH_05779 [Tolypocladium ophioglossoides CBS 100239]|uniref:Uncharacterized protein n=1 Tax=Tolypocladium ophioglossoides (strain CBS 100239) TaxID=1163406 RepID=A0A0L0N6D0_TOLOC|nr:hypothetical protein TOPH_05779 [Tolypocladium ophioglossoides CBS 100239]
MLATTAVIPAPMMTAPPPEYGLGPLNAGFATQRKFKKHKVLPRPRNDRGLDDTRSIPTKYDLIINTSPSGNLDGSQPSSPRTLKHESRRIGAGPDLPPTPPSHSRNSSSSHSALPSSPTIADSGLQTPQHTIRRPIATPPDQRSPPTPDVTPPGPATRPRALRPSVLDRGLPKTTVTDSRTESFKTAREEPLSSSDEGGKSTVRPTLGSATTSRTTVLQIPDAKSSRTIQPQALDLALERLEIAATDTYAPRTRGEFGKFDGDWGSPSDVEQEWDDNLERVVTIRKGRAGPGGPEPPQQNEHNGILEDNMVTPTNATKAVRRMSLREVAALNSSPKRTSDRRRGPSGPSNSEPSVHVDTPRSSGHSTKSNPSTVVEAMLVDVPPQRQRTLRHVRKQRTLREPSPSQPKPAVKGAGVNQPTKSLPAAKQRPEPSHRHDSYTSNTTTNSISSGRARREVWKNGGIPVVVVPDRRSSSKAKSSKEPSLRSTSSRLTKRTLSVGSTSRDLSPSKDVAPVFERRPRGGRSRAPSESDSLEQRTIDFPPAIPARTSSLSAPTSRNASRAGSLTADSLKALNNLQHPPVRSPEQATTRAPELEPSLMPEMVIQSPVSISGRFEREETQEFLSLGRHDDAASSKRYSSRNTPFSIASFETTGTALEVSEALAVHMYPHQNSSILMVNHSAKPSEASDTSNKEAEANESFGPPKITTASPDGGPVTPPQQHGSSDEVDSPLRNPRPPPPPPTHLPAINFIPATPSGVTPVDERLVQLGNYYEATGEKPPRRPSIVRRVLGRRRHSIDYPPTASKPPGFLTRTLSLSRNVGYYSAAATGKGINPDKDPAYPRKEDKPTDQDKVHPFWRPQWFDDERFECDGNCSHGDHDTEDEVYRYPPVDNRPRMPKRSLSARMKRTFAIMPVRDDEYYPADNMHGPERRTIKRTPSGNLRVMRRRASAESLRKRESMRHGPLAASDEGMRRSFWRGHSLRRRNRLEGIQGLPRRLSERRREKRTQELRQMISGPTEVRDGVEEVIKPTSARNRQYDNSALI